MWRKFRRIVMNILLLFGVVLAGILISIYIYKDKIVEQLIREANSYINTPIRVEEIQLDLLEKFPHIAVSFTDVIVEESWPQSRNPLLKARRVYLTLDPMQLIRGQYEIYQLHIEDGEIYIRMNEQGQNNYEIFSQKREDNRSNDSLIVDLKRVSLKKVFIHYQDERNLQDHKYYTDKQEASLRLERELYLIRSSGDITSEYIRIRGKEFAKNKNSHLETQMSFNPTSNVLLIEPSKLKIRNSKYSVSGEIHSGDEPYLNLNIDGIDTNIQSLISLLPQDVVENLKEYKSKGEVYFNMNLRGYTRKNVAIEVRFGLNNAELSHPELSKKATDVFLNGKFSTPSFSSFQNSTLELAGVKGTFGSNPFEGNLTMINLEDPEMDMDLTGTFDMEEIMKWVPGSRITSGDGLVTCQINLTGRINDLKSRYTSQKVKTSGEVEFDNVVFTFEQDFPAPTTIDGSFVFNRNDLAINNASVKTGESQWTMNGYFRNILPFLLFKNQHFGIEADIKGSFVNVAELLPVNDRHSEEEIEFEISPFLILDLNCAIDHLRYRKFKAREVTGELKVKDSRVFAQNIEFKAMGGQLRFSGLVNAAQRNINITSSSHWENLAIDSVFYVFSNFNQDWLVAENLKGNIFADVMTDMTFSRALKFYSDSLVTDISISIVDGELNNFEPMMQLEKYVDDENLAHLRFSELTNDIHVEDRKIYLPEMEVQSNVSNIRISGSHTFDQEIDYRVVVPLKTLGKKRNEDMFGAVEDDGSGSKLHLKIVGTTDDYEIKYDAEGVKNKVIADLKKEVEELKDAFRKKETKPEEAVLNEEEFFEWEEDTVKHKNPRINQY